MHISQSADAQRRSHDPIFAKLGQTVRSMYQPCVTNVSYVRDSPRNHRSRRRRERKRSHHDRHLAYGHRGNLQKSMTLRRDGRESERMYSRVLVSVKRLTWDSVHTLARICGKNRYRLAQNDGGKRNSRNSELNKGRIENTLVQLVFRPPFFWNALQSLLMKTSPLSILAPSSAQKMSHFNVDSNQIQRLQVCAIFPYFK